MTCDSTGATLCDDNYVFGILNSAQTNRCISTDVCATTYHGYDNSTSFGEHIAVRHPWLTAFTSAHRWSL